MEEFNIVFCILSDILLLGIMIIIDIVAKSIEESE